jgi:S-DNA-T family DNA segregation ATPase FtsK/SpoIIIE
MLKEDDKDLVEEATQLFINDEEARKVIGPSFLQRRFRLSYAEAKKLIEDLEGLQIIGPRNGSKPRKFLLDV